MWHEDRWSDSRSHADLAIQARRLALYLGQPEPRLNARLLVNWRAGRCALSPWQQFLAALIAGRLAPGRMPAVDVERDRRAFVRQALAFLAGASIDPGRLASVLARSGRRWGAGSYAVDRELVEQLREVGAQTVSQWDSLPPSVLLRLLLLQMEQVRAMLAGPLPRALRSELLVIGAHAGTMAGLAARFLGHDDEARQHLAQAIQLAQSAGESGLEAMAMMFIADTVSGVQRGALPLVPQSRIMDMLPRIEDLAGPTVHPSVRAFLFYRVAEEHAAAGEPDTALTYIDRAEHVWATSVETVEPGLYGLGWHSAAYHSAFRGNILLLCNRPASALDELRDGYGALLPEAVSNRASILSDMGAAQARLGEIEAACDSLGRAFGVARAAGLHDRMTRISGVRQRDLGRWGSAQAITRLDEQLASV